MSTSDLRSRYRELPDEQLREIVASGDGVFTREALAAAELELRQRGVDPTSVAPAPAPVLSDAHRQWKPLAVVVFLAAAILGGVLCRNRTAEGPPEPILACDSHDYMSCKAACEHGSREACYHQAFGLEGGFGTRRSIPVALGVYAKSCNLGFGEGCTRAGQLVGYDHRIETSLTSARQYFTHACQMHDQEGCVALGYQLRKGEGGPRDNTTARQLFEDACAAKHGAGCTELGYLFEEGDGVAEDLGRAAELYRRGCESRSLNGCYALALLQRTGRGLPADPKAAQQQFEHLCKDGIKRACKEANMEDPSKNFRAREHDQTLEHERKCLDGDLSACDVAASDYKVGIGVDADFDRGLKYATKACDGGLARGCYTLAHMVRTGAGYGLDPKQSHEYFVKACMLGEDLACRWLKQPW